MTCGIAVLRQRIGQLGSRPGTAAALLSMALVTSACSTGAYPLDIFPEMHYQQSFRSQEPPRLDAPAGSVPTNSSYVEGQVVREEPPVDLGKGLTMKNPLAKNDANLASGQRLFAVNCVPCHGEGGKGDGKLATYFRAAGPQVPVDLTGPRGLLWSEGQLFSIITNGQPPGYFDSPAAKMPAFGHLLTPDERWLIVMQVQRLQGR